MSNHIAEEMAPPLSPDEYVNALTSSPIIQKVTLLFDDRPESVSIRIEYLKNLYRAEASLTSEAMTDIDGFLRTARIKNCKNINITFVQKEVIE